MTDRVPHRIAAPWWPRLTQVLPLELVLAVAIAAMTMALCIADIPAIRFKAQFTEVLIASISPRLALAEHMALTGTWDGLEDKPSVPAGERATAASRTYSGIAAGNATLHSRAPGRDEVPVTVAFRPALAANDLPWTSLWLCGAGEPPEGWTAPAVTVPHNLPGEFLLSNCRRGKNR